MNATREKFYGAVSVMGSDGVMKSDEAVWASIPEVEPDEFDLKMLREIEEDPDCQEFVKPDEAHVRIQELELAEA